MPPEATGQLAPLRRRLPLAAWFQAGGIQQREQQMNFLLSRVLYRNRSLTQTYTIRPASGSACGWLTRARLINEKETCVDRIADTRPAAATRAG